MRRFLNPSAGSSGQDVAEFALSGTSVEGTFALRAKLEILQAQYREAVLFSDHRTMNDHFQREQTLQTNRPGDAQLKRHPAGEFLIAFEANHFIAEISRPATSMKGAVATPVGELKFDVQLIPRVRPALGC
jgi:hypothetical protein